MLTKTVAACLQIDESAVQVTRPLHAYGVDSLVALEIRAWIFRQLKVDITTIDLTGKAPIKALVGQILSTSLIVSEALREQRCSVGILNHLSV